ncbi:interferon-related developmental regulator 1 [Coccinella septempunctata]|uniref:interferon-related developmental regulator 1 n=1 Tax=Coccinella septempunctata TaxID=41139 RepID=UPI001D077947|nr:interferon-related developmental regulator 1 [Coccinella septempunctata]
MPKGKRRAKSERYENAMQNSDDESCDNASVFSVETKSASDDGEDEFLQDQFEEKLIELMDGLTQKSSQGRTNCLLNISKALVSKYVPAFVSDRHFTLCDGIERCLKKGSTAERSAASELASIICVQLGAESGCEEVCKALKPVLMTTAADNSVSPAVRGKCCATLGLISFLANSEVGDILSLMRQFESFFSGSYHKGDGSNNNVTPEQANFHAAALSAWGLLLTTIDSSSVSMMLETKSLISIKKLAELLESQHLEVRMTAGDVLALLYEVGKMEPDDFGEDFDEIIASLKGLATDSHKYRAKKDRKQQRASFRDILMYIEEDVLPEVRVKFGKEVLELDSWTKRKQYDTLCTILGPGINIHLAENDFLRELFEISDPLITTGTNNLHAQSQMERFRRKLQNAANFKARSIARRATRDKRLEY